MTDRPDAPDAPVARVRDGATTSEQPDEHGGPGARTSAEPHIGRRKLMYAAPAVLSQSMFYALAGCGKAQPQQINCFRVPRSGS